jgi:signal transduction histidine kinase
MPEGGTIIIDARFLLNGAEGFRKSPTVVITITDSGKGIDADMVKHVFEPFWTSKAEGTGLGLAIIYRIIEAHAGSIRVDTPSSGGCCFTIMLPV